MHTADGTFFQVDMGRGNRLGLGFELVNEQPLEREHWWRMEAFFTVEGKLPLDLSQGASLFFKEVDGLPIDNRSRFVQALREHPVKVIRQRHYELLDQLALAVEDFFATHPYPDGVEMEQALRALQEYRAQAVVARAGELNSER